MVRPAAKRRRRICNAAPQCYPDNPGICDIVAEAGEAEGAAISVLPMLRRSSHNPAALRQWMAQSLIPKLMREHGIVAARYIEKNPAALAAGTAEHLRPTDKQSMTL